MPEWRQQQQAVELGSHLSVTAFAVGQSGLADRELQWALGHIVGNAIDQQQGEPVPAGITQQHSQTSGCANE